MDIKEIAERVSKRIYVEDGLLLSKFISEKFAEALIAELAKAEQRVAEACALTYLEDYDLTDIAERVRAGEYRKFMKGE